MDPGFPVGGDANPRGAPAYDFVKFCEKLHEIENILGRGGCTLGPPKSATVDIKLYLGKAIRSTAYIWTELDLSDVESRQIFLP